MEGTLEVDMGVTQMVVMVAAVVAMVAADATMVAVAEVIMAAGAVHMLVRLWMLSQKLNRKTNIQLLCILMLQCLWSKLRAYMYKNYVLCYENKNLISGIHSPLDELLHIMMYFFLLQ